VFSGDTWKFTNKQ